MPETIHCESRITRVVVYARGAVVTRQVELPVSVPPEGVTLDVGGITALSDAASFRTSVDGERTVTGLRAPLVAPGEAAAPAPDEVLLRSLLRDVARLNEQVQRAQRRRDLLAAMSIDADLKVPVAGPADKSPGLGPGIEKRVGDALAVSALRHELLCEQDKRIHDLQAKLRDLNQQLHIARNPEKTRSGPAGYSRSAQVTLAPGGEHLRNLEVSYTVRAARWWPAYAARLENGGTRADFSLEAFVAQASGEDWRGAKLSLCTADMLTDITLPQLASLRYGRRQPPRRTGFRAPPEGLDALFAGYDTFEAPPSVPEPVAYAAPADDEDEEQASYAAPAEAMDYKTMAEASMLSSADMAPSAPPASAPYGGAAPVRQSAPMPRAAKKSESRRDEEKAKERSGVAKAMSRQRILADEGAGGGGDYADMEMDQAEAPEFADAPDAEEWLDFDMLALAPGIHHRRGRLIRGHARTAPGYEQAGHLIEGMSGPGGASDPRYARGMFDHQFEATTAVEIPCDGVAHRIRLLSKPAKSRMRMRCVPLADERVFREVELENPLEAPLLPGPVDVFMDGALLITAHVGAVDRGGTVRFGLGEEQRVSVVRNMRATEETKGLIGGKSAVLHHLSIEAASSLAAEVELELIERVPVTGKEVTVDAVSSSPKAEPYKQEERGFPVKGGVRWLIKLPPGGKQELQLKYTLVFDKDYEVEGGNRRA
ncbi:MAG: DUF4139 domain-containing protein [Planctomycetes bacterium]|nr:DUF4139 domain-containing protein [Planctomycetota bacterium]MCW8135078.1 DUF4139 domain-containing protein [Planctomycetota bacterium]